MSEIAFDVIVIILLCVLLVRQEMNHMELDDKVTAIEADEAALATTLGVLIADLKAAVPVPQSILDRLDALHVNAPRRHPHDPRLRRQDPGRGRPRR